MPNAATTNAIFVYGTLKRGQCRQSRWPIAPHSILPAWVHGSLFDRSDYPAMTAGGDRVQGELWQFTADQIDQVLEVLDEIEAAPELYRRVTVEAFDDQDQSLGTAWTYHYATDPANDGFERIEPDEKSRVGWPR